MGCCGGDSDGKGGKAKQHDPNFRGPMKNRGCTDIICCLIFFVFILAYMVVSVFAWLNGNPLLLLHPTDSTGRICGLKYNDLDLEEKTSLFFFDLTKCTDIRTAISFQCPTTQTCVKTCPNENWTYLIEEAKAAAVPGTRQQKADAIDWNKFVCEYGYNPRENYLKDVELVDMVTQEKCAAYYIKSSSMAGRCIPAVNETISAITVGTQNIENTAGQAINGTILSAAVEPIKAFLNARSIAEQIFADFTVAWQWMLVLLIVSAVVAFLWIVLMRWLAGPMVWITLFSFVALCSVGVWYCWQEYNELKNQPGSDQSIISIGFTTDLSTYLALTDTWLAFLIILSVVDAIILLVIIFLRKRILIATKVITHASKAVGSMISTLFYPLITFVMCTIVVGFWALTALFLASSQEPVYKWVDSSDPRPADSPHNTTCLPQENTTFANTKCEFIEYGGDSVFQQNTGWLQWGMLFGMLWLMNWVLALGQCTLAGCFASYYWAWDKSKDIPYFPLYQSFGRSLRYHTGSLAFGAFIIALVQLIRIFLEYLNQKLKKSENKAAKFIMTCLRCCFWCLEKFLKFINRNAYIMIAIYGKNFCWSAKEAFKLLFRNILRAAVLDKVVDFVLLMGKLVVVAAMGVITFFLFTNRFNIAFLEAPNLNYYWMPIIVITLSTYLIASGFFNTFGMAADTIFLCFLEDLERNDGSEEKPYYMPKGLLKLLGKKNKKNKEESS